MLYGQQQMYPQAQQQQMYSPQQQVAQPQQVAQQQQMSPEQLIAYGRALQSQQAGGQVAPVTQMNQSMGFNNQQQGVSNGAGMVNMGTQRPSQQVAQSTSRRYSEDPTQPVEQPAPAQPVYVQPTAQAQPSVTQQRTNMRPLPGSEYMPLTTDPMYVDKHEQGDTYKWVILPGLEEDEMPIDSVTVDDEDLNIISCAIKSGFKSSLVVSNLVLVSHSNNKDITKSSLVNTANFISKCSSETIESLLSESNSIPEIIDNLNLVTNSVDKEVIKYLDIKLTNIVNDTITKTLGYTPKVGSCLEDYTSLQPYLSKKIDESSVKKAMIAVNHAFKRYRKNVLNNVGVFDVNIETEAYRTDMVPTFISVQYVSCKIVASILSNVKDEILSIRSDGAPSLHNYIDAEFNEQDIEQIVFVTPNDKAYIVRETIYDYYTIEAV